MMAQEAGDRGAVVRRRSATGSSEELIRPPRWAGVQRRHEGPQRPTHASSPAKRV